MTQKSLNVVLVGNQLAQELSFEQNEFSKNWIGRGAFWLIHESVCCKSWACRQESRIGEYDYEVCNSFVWERSSTCRRRGRHQWRNWSYFLGIWWNAVTGFAKREDTLSFDGKGGNDSWYGSGSTTSHISRLTKHTWSFWKDTTHRLTWLYPHHLKIIGLVYKDPPIVQ